MTQHQTGSRPEIDRKDPSREEFEEAVLRGLAGEPRTLPCKFLYDAKGSELFDRICETKDYYPTRTELGILRTRMGEIAEAIGPGAVVIEPGVGSSLKPRLLLEGLRSPAAFVPVEISHEALRGCVDELSADFPGVEMRPVCADFTQHFDLPDDLAHHDHRLVFFPGSTIGNFEPEAAENLLREFAGLIDEAEGGVLLGFDLEKDPDVLRAAYNDSEGVTAAFNMNLLDRLERELEAEICGSAFRHEARWNPELARMEMHLVSARDHTVRVAGESFAFAEGETIHTENSHKFTPERMEALASRAGLRVERIWTDDDGLFAVGLLRRVR